MINRSSKKLNQMRASTQNCSVNIISDIREKQCIKRKDASESIDSSTSHTKKKQKHMPPLQLFSKFKSPEGEPSTHSFSRKIKDEKLRNAYRFGHHKFPKSYLGSMCRLFTTKQKRHFSMRFGNTVASNLSPRDRSNLKKHKPKKLEELYKRPIPLTPVFFARLPSNIISSKIPSGYVTPEMRADDPDHKKLTITNDGPLDLIYTNDGHLTPRSREYSNLYQYIAQIEPNVVEHKKFSDKQANKILGHFTRAENYHKRLQPNQSNSPCNYGPNFWKIRDDGKWQKTEVDAKAFYLRKAKSLKVR